MKIAFIGGGNMGEAILAAMLGKKLAIAKDITVSDLVEIRRQYLDAKIRRRAYLPIISWQSKAKRLLFSRLNRKH